MISGEAARQAFTRDTLFTETPLHRVSAAAEIAWRGGKPRIGVIHNALARHNIGRHLPLVIPGCDHVMPLTHEELHDVLAGFVANGVDLLIVDGGDGTVRDVISAMVRHFPSFRPHFAIVPSGKTNALARDLGIPASLTLTQVIEGVAGGHVVERSPLEIWRAGALRPDFVGFIFGSGAFVRATKLAQQTHRFGAFNGLAVGLSIIAGVGQTVLAGEGNPWRRGERMRIKVATDAVVDGPHYIVLASTLERMPLGIKPFGPTRPGLKMLRIEAPVRHILKASPAVLRGTDRAWLSGAGYHRRDGTQIDISLDGDFVLDGETFAGGALSLRQGRPIAFMIP